MKKLTAFLVTALIFARVASVSAQSPTASVSGTPKTSPTGSQTIEDKLIQTFKEKVATKVAELRKKNIKPAVGRITSIKGSTVEIKGRDANYIVKIDDNLTNFYDIHTGTKKEIALDDLAKNDYIIVSGPELDKVVTANTVFRDEEYFTKSGKITEVNTVDDYLRILSSEKDIITLDIPANLRMQMVNSKTLAFEPISMAKVKEGDTIHFVYKKTGDEKEANRYDAERVLIIPQEYFQK